MMDHPVADPSKNQVETQGADPSRSKGQAHKIVPDSSPDAIRASQGVIGRGRRGNKADEELHRLMPTSADMDPYKPPRGLRIAFFGVVVMLMTIGAWAVFGAVDIVAVARGKVIATSGIKRIQTLETGVVREILVSEGQSVEAGQVLVRMDSTDAATILNRIAYDISDVNAEIFIVEAMLDAPDKGVAHADIPAGVLASIGANHLETMRSEVNRYRAAIELIDSRIEEQTARVAANKASAEKYKKLIPLMQERMEARRFLAQRGNGTRHSAIEAEQEYIDAEQGLLVEESRITEGMASINRLHQELELAKAERRVTLQARLMTAQQQLNSLDQERIRTQQSAFYQELRAPVRGYVQGLHVQAPGEVLESGQELMSIVPADDVLEMEGLIDNKDIGFVRIGQTAEVKFRTFPYTMYGTFPGTVRQVAADAVENNGKLVYPVRVALDQVSVPVDGREVPITTGMEGVIDIKIGKRQVYQFFLAPLLRLRNESLRER